MMEKDSYLGRILTGRVSSGVIRVGDKIHGLRNTDAGVEKVEEGKVSGLWKYIWIVKFEMKHLRQINLKLQL